FCKLAADPATPRDVEIRRRELYPSVVRCDGHVWRDRQRATTRNRTPDDAQTSCEVLLQTRNLHRAHLRHHLDASIRQPRKRDNRSTRVIIFARYARWPLGALRGP